MLLTHVVMYEVESLSCGEMDGGRKSGRERRRGGREERGRGGREGEEEGTEREGKRVEEEERDRKRGNRGGGIEEVQRGVSILIFLRCS